MKKQMKLSIIIPIYNAENFLKRCLDSVLGQSIKEKEIICVDDGSTDNSLNILKEYAKKYDNIYILKQENKFAGIARNYGLTIAKGEYIHFLDADDYILNDIYSQIYTLAVKMDADYIKTRNIAFDMVSEEYIDIPDYTLENLNIQYFNQLLSLNEHSEMLLCNSVTPWCGWVKKSYIVKNMIKFNNLKCVNDRSFYTEVIINTDKIVLSDYYMVAHQINNSKSLAGERNKDYICNLQSYQIIKNKLREFSIAIQKKILTVELYALLNCYEELTEEQKKENINLLKDFFKDFNWNDINKEILLNPSIKYISEKFKIPLKKFFDSYFIIDSLIDLEHYLKNEEDIVVYGAGKVCKELIEYMKNQHLKTVNYIVVSNISNNPEFIYGIPVKLFSEEIVDYTQRIIIAVLENIQMPIYFNLINSGYKNVQVISSTTYKKLANINNYYRNIRK